MTLLHSHKGNGEEEDNYLDNIILMFQNCQRTWASSIVTVRHALEPGPLPVGNDN